MDRGRKAKEGCKRISAGEVELFELGETAHTTSHVQCDCCTVFPVAAAHSSCLLYTSPSPRDRG
eukprot:1259808-Rhodomonas_salina.1